MPFSARDDEYDQLQSINYKMTIEINWKKILLIVLWSFYLLVG